MHSSVLQRLSILQIPVETITLKYFEKGHILIASDSLHHQVEVGICKHRYLFDFNNYVQTVNYCRDAIEMSHEDFHDFRNYKSNGKDTNYPLIADISFVQFRKSDTKIYWKTSFNDSEFKSGQFLQKNSAAYAVKSDCQERMGLREVLARQRRMIS